MHSEALAHVQLCMIVHCCGLGSSYMKSEPALHVVCSWSVAVHRITKTGMPTVISAAPCRCLQSSIVPCQCHAAQSAAIFTVDFA